VLPHIAPEKRLRAIYDIRDAAASEAISERETTAVRSDGSHLALRSTLIPVRDAEGNPSAVLSVTRWVPGGLSAGGRQDDFATLVAKQLRDPLASISGFTQLLQRPEILDDPVRRERTVKALAERAKYVSSLLDDLQLVAEIEEGRFELSKETTELGLLVTEAAEHVDPKGTRILVDFDPNLAPVSVDQNRVAQAVTRLVENAVRYSPETASVEVSVFGADDYVVIEVSDSGSDVDPVEGSEVFERSYFGAPGAPRALGLGVGLYLVRMITEAHGGAVLFKSEPGAGNTFSIRLPRTADGS
jgi:signal transduction histidine kinase